MLLDGGCVVCGGATGPVCGACERSLIRAGQVVVPGLDACMAGFALDDTCRTIVAALKYQRQRRLASWLAHALAALVPLGADCISWVPATPKRQRSRGFDQAQQLALALSKHTGVPSLRLLGRASDDLRQTGQSRNERRNGPSLYAKQNCPPFVVVIDDVVTTGSSLTKAAHTIRSAGATRVVGVVGAATPLNRELLLHGAKIPSIIHKWT